MLVSELSFLEEQCGLDEPLTGPFGMGSLYASVIQGLQSSEEPETWMSTFLKKKSGSLAGPFGVCRERFLRNSSPERPRNLTEFQSLLRRVGIYPMSQTCPGYASRSPNSFGCARMRNEERSVRVRQHKERNLC